MREPKDVIGDTLKTHLHQPQRVSEAANAIIGALTSAGYAIVPRRPGTGRLVVQPKGPRPIMTNAVATNQPQRGVFVTGDDETK